MPTTTRQMAKIAHVAEQTIRNYTRDYAELLSPAARGEVGARLFDDQDVQTLITIAALRKEDVPAAEIIARLRAGDLFIDPTPTPQQTTPSPQQTPEATYALMVSPSELQALREEVSEIKRTQRLLLRAAVQWGALLGAIAAFAAGGFVLWVLYLLAR